MQMTSRDAVVAQQLIVRRTQLVYFICRAARDHLSGAINIIINEGVKVGSLTLRAARITKDAIADACLSD